MGRLHEAIEGLNPNHREILLLREVDGLSYDEIALALEINKGTVMSRLFHARKQVQKKLGPYLDGDISV